MGKVVHTEKELFESIWCAFNPTTEYDKYFLMGCLYIGFVLVLLNVTPGNLNAGSTTENKNMFMFLFVNILKYISSSRLVLLKINLCYLQIIQKLKYY